MIQNTIIITPSQLQSHPKRLHIIKLIINIHTLSKSYNIRDNPIVIDGNWTIATSKNIVYKMLLIPNTLRE